ncbi:MULTISPECIES: GAP1-N2 domain-containing protein [unclassified Paenibacillus]|uniref:GAP1-N2 domain-containing protein n=1 Tax=unclassified Paenibacillus TaxID=185978 RepID=UPI0036450127
MIEQRKPIQQQYFTRDREGIFRTSEGFDTVAKSEGLDNTFIKNTLHPYCVYKAPKELLGRAEEDSSLYPESMVVFHAENGDMVIGRSVYIGTDFTGQRSASFTHQFIVPNERKDEFLRDPQRLFRIRSFESSYDIRNGKSLPELDGISYGTAPVEAVEQERLLTKLGIDQTRFQQLIYAVMSSVTSKKKVYIALDEDIAETAESAKKLLEIVYRCLPYAIRSQLGFMTFNSEPEGKQHLHVIFVEKGSIRLPDRNMEKEYIFDFPSKRFVNTDLPGQEHSYLSFIWNKRNDSEQLEQLFGFCEEALQGLDKAAALNVQTYVQLQALYEVEQGNEALYEANRAEIMQSIVTYVNADTVRQKRRLNELFIRLLGKEARDSDSLPTADYIKYLLHYYGFADEGVKTLLARCFVIFISRVAKKTEDGIENAAPIFDQLLGKSSMFDLVMKELYNQQSGTAESYIAYRMGKAGTVKALLEEIRFWIQQSESMVQQRFFANEVLKKVKRLLQTDSLRKRIEAASSLYRYFEELPERQERRQYEDFCGQLKLEIKLLLLDGLKITDLEYEDMMQLSFMLELVDQELNSHLDKSQKLNLQLLATIYRVLKVNEKEDSELRKAFDFFGPLDLERVQQSLKKLLGMRIASEHFSKIVYAFYQPGSSNGSGYVAEFDYYGLLQYIAEATRGTETIYDFLVWSANDQRFLNMKQEIDANYKAAVSKFFDMNAPRAFRDKEIRLKLLATSNESFVALYKAIKLRQAGKLIRFVVKNRRRLTRLGLIILPLIILIIIFRNPIGIGLAAIGPAPAILIDEIPAISKEAVITVTVSAKGEDPTVSLYVNGQLEGNGKVTKNLDLLDGDNTFEFKAVNRGGKASEVVKKKVSFSSPTPIVTVEALPETTRNNSITVKITALDRNDPSPTLYINGQAVGQSSASKAVSLTPGENLIEIKAGNKQGKMSEPIVKKIKMEPAPAR